MVLIHLETECKDLTVTAVKDSLQMKMKAKVACTCEGDYQPNVLISSLDLCSKNVCFLNDNDAFYFYHAFLPRTPRHSVFVICPFIRKEGEKSINIC